MKVRHIILVFTLTLLLSLIDSQTLPTVTAQTILNQADTCTSLQPDVEGMLVYESTDGNDHGLWVVAPGQPAEQLYSNQVQRDTARWSPDGSQIAFSGHTLTGATGNLFVVDVESKSVRQLVDGATLTDNRTQSFEWIGNFANGGGVSSLEWSPDGTQIAFTVDYDKLFIVPAEGGNPELVASAVIYRFIWSEDGDRLYYVNPDGVGMYDLTTGQSSLFVAMASFENAKIGYSNTGRLLFWPGNDFGVSSSGDGGYQINETTGDTSTVSSSTFIFAEAWSPNGNLLLQEPRFPAGLEVRDENYNTITLTEFPWAFYRWAPDNTWIAAYSSARENLYLLDRTGTQLCLIDEQAHLGRWRPNYSPDATIIEAPIEEETAEQIANNEVIETLIQSGEAWTPTNLPVPANGQITHASFSPDGQYLVTLLHNGEIRVSDAFTGETLRNYEDPQRVYTAGYWRIEWSEDNRTMEIIGRSRESNLVDFSTLNDAFDEESFFRQNPQESLNLFFDSWSPDGKWLIRIDLGDGHTNLWDLENNESVADIFGNPAIENSRKVWSPDSRYVVTYSARFGNYLLDVENFDSPLLLPETEGENSSYAAWSPNGELFAVANEEQVNVYDVTGTLQGSVDIAETDDVFLEWDKASNRLLIATGRGQVIVVDTGQEAILLQSNFTESLGWINRLASIHPNGRYVAVIQPENAFIFDIDSGDALVRLPLITQNTEEPVERVQAIQWHPTQPRLLTVAVQAVDFSVNITGTPLMGITLWDQTSAETADTATPAESVLQIGDPDASYSRPSETVNIAPVPPVFETNEVTGHPVLINSNQTHAVLAPDSSEFTPKPLTIVDLTTGEAVSIQTYRPPSQEPHAKWHPTDDRLLVPDDNMLYIVNPQGEILQEIEHAHTMASYSWSPDGNNIYTSMSSILGCRDNPDCAPGLHIWDGTTGNFLFIGGPLEYDLYNAQFIADYMIWNGDQYNLGGIFRSPGERIGTLTASSSDSGWVYTTTGLVNVTTGERQGERVNISNSQFERAWLYGSEYLIGYDRTTIQIYDVQLGEQTRIYQVADILLSAEISSDHTRMLTVDRDGIVTMWELSTGNALYRVDMGPEFVVPANSRVPASDLRAEPYNMDIWWDGATDTAIITRHALLATTSAYRFTFSEDAASADSITTLDVNLATTIDQESEQSSNDTVSTDSEPETGEPTTAPIPTNTPMPTATSVPADTSVEMPSATATATNEVTIVSCTGLMPSRLIPGERGQVEPSDGNSNRMRNQPSLSGQEITRIPPGGQFNVLDGPTCADGYAWYQVNYAGQVGWTAESGDGVYWLEPISTNSEASVAPAANACIATPGGTVNLRTGPGTNFDSAGQTSTNQVVTGRGSNLSGFVWYQLESGFWLREDVITLSGDCSDLPIVR